MHEHGNSYDKYPSTTVDGPVWAGWEEIGERLTQHLGGQAPLLVFDTYVGVDDDELTAALRRLWPGAELLETSRMFLGEQEIRAMTQPYVTDDELFGYLSPLGIGDYFDPKKLQSAR